MIISLENCLLAVRPHKDVLLEEMYICEVDGRPAGYAEARGVFSEEKRKVFFYGRSDRLLEQAATFHALGDDEFAESLYAQGLRYAEGEYKVAIALALERTEIQQNSDFDKTAPWLEMNRVDALAEKGREIGIVHYPILNVAWVRGGWNVELGQVHKGKVDDVPDPLSDRSIVVDRMCAPEDLDKKYKPDMRVYLHQKPGGLPEWDGKEIFALGIIRTFS